MKRLAFAAMTLLSLAGCAKRSENISAVYVSPMAYRGLSCEELAEEAQVISSRAIVATGAQDKQAGKDVAVTTVGVVLFWPALFFIDGNDEKAAEVARLKGEMQAIEDTSRRNNCKIEFAKAPAPPAQKKPLGRP
ncbi:MULTISPECIES: hypothetical protein [unclassified Aureimonas]|uniref:hypothetical protein n=1 Tax=unclassified Aureimonas TaxID=2615206 RepID=UPI0006F70876|nr:MULTISPECIES: hypothetical protein [unclassified Aureimonas]KQT57594.1 hypothetical protein ASG62_09495 [Aureimonas sp. Leaf427]KQT77273.1 hypothetical protein ASG54_13365 [Aureimonas sp. Leaf460]